MDLHYESLNKEILNEHLFQKIQAINIVASNVYNVDQDLFKKNHNLTYIEWSIKNIRQFFYTTQNKWLESIHFSIDSVVEVLFLEEKPELNFYELYDYPEEDFCLFIRLQNENSLYSIIDPGKKINCSCTIIWIIMNTEVYFDKKETHDYFPFNKIYEKPPNRNDFQLPMMYCLNEPNFYDLLKQCNFHIKRAFCKISEFSKANRSESILGLNTDTDFYNLMKFIH